MFSFFLKGYRTGLLNFTGSKVEVSFNPDGDEGKFCFRQTENGDIKRNEVIVTRHPNIVRAVMSGKRSFGLWIDQWSEGIVEGNFTEEEILDEFYKRGITIPESLLRDFQNRIDKKKRVRNNKALEMLRR
jgi:hypothetical protein